MNLKILRDKLENLRVKELLARDYIECLILKAQMELLETLLEACE